MVFAYIPADDNTLEDKFFGVGVNVIDKGVEYGMKIRQSFKKKGNEIHTIDMYADLSAVDYFLLEWPRWDKILFLAKKHLLKKTIYMNCEPPTVVSYNCPKGFRLLTKIFPIVLTYNREWADGVTIFRRNNPYNGFEMQFGSVPFAKKKLLTGISGDKVSNYPTEQYSERRKIYSYFEANYHDEFDFYGRGWEANKHPSYKGEVFDKTEIYHKYKFAICLENTSGSCDYVTEKIYDCMCAGIVPIYGGAANIAEYVPKECFINYYEFNDYSELAHFLMNMSENKYNQYINNIEKWLLNKDKYDYSLDKYVDDVLTAINNSTEPNGKMPISILIYIYYKGIAEILWGVLVDLKHRLLGKK